MIYLKRFYFCLYLKKNKNIFIFFTEMIKLRKELSSFFCRDFYHDHMEDKEGDVEIKWVGSNKNKPDWNGSDMFLSVFLKSSDLKEICIIFNSNDKKCRTRSNTGRPKTTHCIVRHLFSLFLTIRIY